MVEDWDGEVNLVLLVPYSVVLLIVVGFKGRNGSRTRGFGLETLRTILTSMSIGTVFGDSGLAPAESLSL